MSLELSEAKRTQALDSLKRFYQEHMDEEIGDLRAVMLLCSVLVRSTFRHL